MSNDLFTTMSSGSGFSLEKLEELNDITTRAFTRLADIQISYAKLGMEGSMEQARLFTSINDYDNLLDAESQLASRYTDQVMGLAQEAGELIDATRGDLIAWMEQRVSEAGDVIKEPLAAMPAAPKPAAKKTTTRKATTKTTATSKPKSSPAKSTKTRAA